MMIAKEIHALLVEGTDHWGVQVALTSDKFKIFFDTLTIIDDHLTNSNILFDTLTIIYIRQIQTFYLRC